MDPSIVVKGNRTCRRSSWDRSGRNKDYLMLEPNQTVTLLDEQGPGKITHFYWTTINGPLFLFRQLVLRAYWDGESAPSIEAPLGDLFCVPHCRPVPVTSLCAVVNPGRSDMASWGLNLYLPMPFAERARLELSYDPIPDHPADVIRFWYHIELERAVEPLPENAGRLHAQWRREKLTRSPAGDQTNRTLWDGANLDGAENYVALEAEGSGQMIGLHLQVDNIAGGWYGEGDDMIFVDGQQEWPPAYHGTGSEEIFGGGACPNHAYSGPYTGFHMVENPDFAGKNAMYRWYLTDPIRFQHSLVWSIEHGHANNYENDYSSLAYWYQVEPHAAFPALPVSKERLPRVAQVVLAADAGRARVRNGIDKLLKTDIAPEEAENLRMAFSTANGLLLEDRYEDALALFSRLEPAG